MMLTNPRGGLMEVRVFNPPAVGTTADMIGALEVLEWAGCREDMTLINGDKVFPGASIADGGERDGFYVVTPDKLAEIRAKATDTEVAANHARQAEDERLSRLRRPVAVERRQQS